ncbi:unnamed protein product [Clonostachys solani]|uniref:Uncharacterized protein n=1 Tax=Clonostachys solani TaxID=160281 RepID=A0A9P0EBA6_9HYPO|nr:unnamed protein product [Clonostachys solani]
MLTKSSPGGNLTRAEAAAEDAIISEELLYRSGKSIQNVQLILRHLEEIPRFLTTPFVKRLEVELSSEAPLENSVKGDSRPVRRLIIVQNKAEGIGRHAGGPQVHCFSKPDR